MDVDTLSSCDDNNNNTATLSISDLTTTEGGSAKFVINLAPASSSTVTVNYQTVSGTATAGSDYTPRSGKIVFNPGETRKTRTVLTTQDNLSEGNEAFTMLLTNSVNAALGQSTGTATINDDDGGSISPCGQPSIDRTTDRALFLWKDCAGDGKWYVRATAGAGSTLSYNGNLTTNQTFSGVTPFSIEGSDTLTASSQTITYIMKVSSPWRDGFEFNVPVGNTCMTMTQPSGQSILVGASRSPVTPPFDIETLGNCVP